MTEPAASAPGLLGTRPPEGRALIRTLGLLVRQAPLACVAVLAASLPPALAGAAAVVASRRLFAGILNASPAGEVLRAGAVYTAVLLVQGVLPAASGLPIAAMTDRLQTAVQRAFLAQVGRLRLEALDDPRVQDTVGRVRALIDDGRLLRTGRRVLFTPRTVLQAAGTAAGLCVLSPWLAAAVVVAGLPTLVQRLRLGPLFYWFEARRSRRQRALDYLAGLVAGRAAAAEIRAFRLGPLLLDRWRAEQRSLAGERRALELRELAGAVVSHLLGTGAAGYGLAMALAVDLSVHGRLSVASLAAALTGLWQFGDEFRFAVIQAGTVRTEALALGDLVALLDAPAVEDAAAGRPCPHPLRTGIRLEGVGFTYPGQDRPALSGVSLTIGAGEHVAVVGGNGAGKTTLARVLLGLYRPQVGRVTVDGVPREAIAAADWRRHVAAVFQSPLRHRLTLREDIALGDVEGGVADAAVLAAAAAGGVQDVLVGLPGGLGTWLDPARPGGVDLSGGQWQRLGMARAAVRLDGANLVLLDEPTANLDPLVEAEVFGGFARAARGRAAVLISHRLGMARRCDRVVVLDGGRVAEEGTHSELVALGGLYARLWETQAAWYR